MRTYFHLCMMVLMDEETQKRGAISVVHALHSSDSSNTTENPKSRDPIMIWEGTQLVLKAIPLRFVGCHICTNPSSISSNFYASMARFVGDTGMVRIRFHQGKNKKKSVYI